ncbi:putative calcium/calmodulin-dependent protein kinase camk1 [Hordeum vulgare]|nr:putative calcium/calmodulin-dependent protein kinase camk1 [Hordeum vulgare]
MKAVMSASPTIRASRPCKVRKRNISDLRGQAVQEEEVVPISMMAHQQIEFSILIKGGKLTLEGHPWIRDAQQVKIPLDMIIYKIMRAYISSSSLRKSALRHAVAENGKWNWQAMVKNSTDAMNDSKVIDFVTMIFQALEALIHYEGKSFNLIQCWMIINEEEKFKAQYAAIKARGGKEALEEHATLQSMIANKDSRKEKRRQDKEKLIRALMEIQNKKLALEKEKQAKMLEIEATKAREVRLACIMKGVEIMKLNLSTIFSNKRSWFKKMQADMFTIEDD